MTDEERARYAQEQRERCKPKECWYAQHCWVVFGGKGTLDSLANKSPRCAACGGKLRLTNWTEPRELALTPRAEHLARNHARKSRQYALDLS